MYNFFRKFGLAALIGALIAILGGILAKYNLKFKSYIKPINMKLYHATIGMIIFLLAMIAVSLATYSNYFHNRMKNTPWVGRLCLWAPIILAGKQKLDFFFLKSGSTFSKFFLIFSLRSKTSHSIVSSKNFSYQRQRN